MFTFSRLYVGAHLSGLWERALHSLISLKNLNVWELKEVGSQKQNEFLVYFVVTLWFNTFYQSLKYLTTEDLGNGVP